MKASTAQLYLQCHRPTGRNDPLVEKAVRFAENESNLQAKLREQTAFDEQVMAAIHALQAPADLKRRLTARGTEPSAKPKGRPQFTVPIILTMICGILSIVGLLVVMEMDHLEHFPGREEAEKMIDAANGMTGVEMDAGTSSNTAGQLGDWFYLHGFDGYAAPEELAAMPALGSRVMRLDGKPVAQVALHDCILYVFRASDFGVEVPDKKNWIVFDHEGWAGAVRRREDAGSLVILKGSKAEMDQFLRTLHAP
jgi:hypothetical protein